jgi:CBS domain-containing protein
VRVQDVMTSDVWAVSPQTGLKEVAALMTAHEISGVPVVEDGRPVGVVAQSDIVRVEQQAESELGRRRWPRRGAGAPLPKRTAGEAMSHPPVTVAPMLSVVGAARRMTQHDVNRLLVVAGGQLAGIVTRSDLVRAFARSDEQIRTEILGEVFPSLGVSANDVDVTVHDGVIELTGEVEDELDARCLPHAVRSVIGVVDVSSTIQARHAHRSAEVYG